MNATIKAFRAGTERTVSPAETVARMRPLFGPVGITRVANVTGLDCIGIPVTMVCRPNARSLAVSQGKGLDLEAARASGIMEAIELYHAERVVCPLKLASWNELRFSHDLVEIPDLPRTSATSFHPNLGLLWIGGIDLVTSRPKWLPYELVHTNYTLPFPNGSGCFVMSSNGLASGNHLLEAISHGLCEVIERDANTLFHLKAGPSQDDVRLDLHSVLDEVSRGLLDRFERASVAVAVWDVTSDVGVAAFRAVIIDREPSPFRPIGAVEGMGCHPVREIALVRALTEAAQARLTIIAGSRDDHGRARYDRSQNRDVVERARKRLLLTGRRRFQDTPTQVNETFEEDVESILKALGRAGLAQAIVVDLTKAEFGVPVARVVVPGLETYHQVQGYVPGKRAQQLLQARELGSAGEKGDLQ